MNVLLSVKPEYVKKILSGEKKYEFRRVIFKRSDIKTVYIYSSSPVSKITVSFKIEKIFMDSPERIWERCHRYAGISKKDFFTYFKNSDKAFAIEIEKANVFKKPIDPFSEFKNFNPPQSFYYLNKEVRY